MIIFFPTFHLQIIAKIYTSRFQLTNDILNRQLRCNNQMILSYILVKIIVTMEFIFLKYKFEYGVNMDITIVSNIVFITILNLQLIRTCLGYSGRTRFNPDLKL